MKKRKSKIGLPPGTLIHIGEQKIEKVKFTVIDYNEKEYTERELESLEECYPYLEKPTVTWLNVDGLHNLDIITELGNHFYIHPLVLEDIVNTDQRPKLEYFEKYLFIMLKMIYQNEKDKKIEQEQVSIILGHHFVISFQEKEGDVFNVIRDRIKKSKGRIRTMGADYLAYSLIDAVVDNYFLILEKFGEELEVMEDELLEDPVPETAQKIHELKRELIFLRKSVWPLREIIYGLERGESPLIQKSTSIFLRDVYDHIIQVLDSVETFRDTISSMLDTYLSSLNNKMNSTMKVLTIIATIFIPLTFIAGIYGMNFQFMPELVWRWGYPTVLSVMCILGVCMFFFFKKKKWM